MQIIPETITATNDAIDIFRLFVHSEKAFFKAHERDELLERLNVDQRAGG